MTRIVMLVVLVLWMALTEVSAQTKTDTKTIEFLKKLDLFYYCPSREGLKDFTCDLVCTTSQTYKDSLYKLGCDAKVLAALDGHIIKLTVGQSNKYKLNVMLPPKSADPDFDAKIKEQLTDIAKNLDPVIDTWNGDVFQPMYGPDDFKMESSVTLTDDGFVLRRTAKDGSILESYFDKQTKMTRVVGTKNGATIITITYDYFWGPRGFVLNSYSADMPAMNFFEADHFTYGKAGNYWLPLKIVKEVQMGKMFQPGSAITCDVTNYHLKE